VVDDVQWVDPATARVLEYVVRRLDKETIGVVVGLRTAGRRPPVDLASAAPESVLQLLDVGPLDDASTRQLILEKAAVPPSLRRLHRLVDLAAGNPLFAVELARSVPSVQAGVDGDESLPTALSDLVRDRVGKLPPQTRELLLLAAILSHPTLTVLARAADQIVEQVVDRLDAAADAGIVRLVANSGEVRFAHPLFAAGVVAVTVSRNRRDAHRRAASVCGELEEMVRHLALATLAPDRQLAEMADRAAERALNRGAPEAAAALARDALRLTPADDPDAAYRRAVTVAEYQFHAGDTVPARGTLEELLRRPASDAERARALRVLAELLYHQESYHDAIEPLTEALTLATDPDQRCHLLIQLAYAMTASGHFEETRKLAHDALQIADAVTDRGLLGSVFATAVIADRLTGGPLDMEMLDRSLELEDPNQQQAMALRPSLIAGHVCLYEGRLAQSQRHLSVVLDDAVGRGNESDVVLVAATLIRAESWAGALESAHGHARLAIETAERLGSDPGICCAHCYASVQYAFRGEHDAASACAARALAVAERSGYPVASLWAWWAQVLAALTSGDPQPAAQAAENLLSVVDAMGLPIPARVMGLADAIELLVTLGQLERAEHYVEVLLESAERTSTSWARMTGLRCRAICAAAHGDLDHAEVLVTDALRGSEELELVIEVARTHLVAGQIARRSRRKRPAQVHIERALQTFNRTGAAGWTAAATKELARARPIGIRPDQLSPTEERVAQLVASGLTNRNVAARLNISPKTVEANLARIYRKLQITSRAELGAWTAHKPNDPSQPAG
jgi:DNA-binding NarL/FixJ family response regulator